ncbi:MAG: hypothetical protein JWN34_1155 [Bryobacterales bacterium]|nr:hypothetical protein [Bryobacterales bacterium]
MKSTVRIALGVVAIAACAFCADNTLGTWKMNPGKSKPQGGQSKIASLTVTREASGNGVKVTAKGEREDKSKIDISYTAKYDGKEVPVSGSGLPYDTVAITRVDDNTLTDTRSKKGGTYKGTGEWVVSNGGKTTTLTTKGTGADGKPFSGFTVYDKQ